MTFTEAKQILTFVKYSNWDFVLSEYSPCGHWYMQVKFKEGSTTLHGRKWLVSPHMTKSELVQTALKAVLTATEHEVREKFTYMERKIFGPHLNVDVLARMSSLTDRREDHVETQEVPRQTVYGNLSGQVQNQG